MLIVGGWFQVKAEEREEFLAGRHEAMRRSRTEPGCIDYTLSADPIEAGRVVLFERWESQEALDAHLAAIRSAPQSAGGVAPTSASIMVYDISAERPLG